LNNDEILSERAEKIIHENKVFVTIEVIAEVVYVLQKVYLVDKSDIKEAIEKGYEVKTGKLEAMAIPKGKIEGVTDGLLKTVVDAKTDKILGCSLLCNTSHEMINVVAAAIKAEQKYTFLRDMLFTHPTMTEALNDLFGSVK